MPQLDKNIPNYLPNMSIQVLDHPQASVYNTIAALYQRFNYFDSVVSDKLKTFIRECWSIEINHKTAEKAVDEAFPKVSRASKGLRLVRKACTLVLYATLIEIMMTRAQGRELLAVSDAELIEKYPSLAGQPEDVLNFLFNFWNYLKVALKVMPAKNSKLDLLDILGHLAGAPKPLKTGKKPSLLVRQCVMLYEIEGDVTAETRGKRKRPKKGEPKKRDRAKKPPGAPRANKQLEANDVMLTAKELAQVRGDEVPVNKKRRTSVSTSVSSRSSGHASRSHSQSHQSTSSGSCSSYSDSDESGDSDENSDSGGNSEYGDNDISDSNGAEVATTATTTTSSDTVHVAINWDSCIVSHSSDTLDTTVVPDYVPSHPSSYYAHSTSTSSSAMMRSFYHMQASTSIHSNLNGHVFAITNPATLLDEMPPTPLFPSSVHDATSAAAAAAADTTNQELLLPSTNSGTDTADEPDVWDLLKEMP